jgi:glucosyl-dolichyl phosphate glucuronosyltransferase
MLSVIIPTRNRGHFLQDAIGSILDQSLPAEYYEIIIVDNGSSDDTKTVVESLKSKNSKKIRYVHESEPGLHNGRHRGVREAVGDILVFVDDDIIADPIWLEMILKTFNDSDVALVGGKVLPKWEGEVPPWIDVFKNKTEYGWTIGYLSLLDFGNASKEIPGKFVFGCNFSIRKDVLYECGGFHPDGMPDELIQYRGDGETALAVAIQARGYRIIYEPKAAIYHRVPFERLTIEYFCQRAFNQGISESYTRIRHQYGLDEYPSRIISPKSNILVKIKKLGRKYFSKQMLLKYLMRSIRKQVDYSREAGKEYHQMQVAQNQKILEHVLKKTYL